jgi:hypothetical protein
MEIISALYCTSEVSMELRHFYYVWIGKSIRNESNTYSLTAHRSKTI